MKIKRFAALALSMTILLCGIPVVHANGTQEIPVTTASLSDEELSPKMDSLFLGSNRESVNRITNQTNMTAGFADGHIRIQTNGAVSDPRVYVTFGGTSIRAAEYPILMMKVRTSVGAPTGFQIFYQQKGADISEASSVRANYANTSDWQYVIVNFGANANITGELSNFRWDVFHNTDAQHYVDIDYMAFFKSEEAASEFAETDDFSRFDDTVYGSVEEDAAPGVRSETPSYTQIKYTYTLDGSKTPAEYRKGTRFGFVNPSLATTAGGVLAGVDASSAFTVYTLKPVGDAYAINDGSFSFDLDYRGGKVTVAQRLLFGRDGKGQSGIHFELSANGDIGIFEASSGCHVTVPTGKTLTDNGSHNICFEDSGDRIDLYVDDVRVLYIGHATVSNTIIVCDANGTSYGTFTSQNLPVCGYASIAVDGLTGSLDNIVYTSAEITKKTYAVEYPTDYSTWTATDDLDRTVPTNVSVSGDKYVGVFYFLNHSADYSRNTIYDTTRLYLDGGASLIASTYKDIAGSASAYWAEPYFGYYTTSDTWIYRKHAQQLAAADVDFIYVDLSNNYFYTDALTRLFDTWLAMRREGQKTPQIVLMFGDMPYTSLNGLFTLKDLIYGNPDYQELLFRYDGKPLFLGNTDTLNDTWTCDESLQTVAQYENLLAANPDVRAFYENEYASLLANFTVRKSWAWKADTTGLLPSQLTHGYWDWLQDSPQNYGTDENGNKEQMAVALGQHAHTDKGRSFLDDDATYNPNGNFGFGLSTTAQGLFFQEQFEYALSKRNSIKVMMITGWNEWTAGVLSASDTQTTGQTASPGFRFIDQFSPEYSRDAEPMKLRDGEGFGDNYYYQMVSYIRRFKGSAMPATVNGGSIDMNAADMDSLWSGINPTFTDGVNDATFRSELSAKGAYLYVNNSARNDIAYAKVSQDADALYFYVKTANELIRSEDESWMNLYVDLDNDPATGWEGYDIVINRNRTTNTASVEKFVDGKWEFQKLGNAEMVVCDSSITLMVNRSILGIDSAATSFNFKWADHSVTDGDIMKFMDLGDAAPDDRFSFAYNASALTDERTGEEEKVYSVKFYGASVTIEDDYALNFKIAEETLASASRYEVILMREGGKQVVFGTGKTQPVLNDEGYYVFSYENLGPHQMGRNVTAILRAYDENGDMIGYDRREYSILQYCKNKLDNPETSDALATTIKDMLNYGAAVQQYLNPSLNDNQLINAGLDTHTTTEAPAVSTDGYAHTPFENRIGFKSASVRINNGVEIVLKVVGSTSNVTVSNGEVLTIDDDGYYVHRISFLNMMDKYTYTVDGATLTYSLPIYIARSGNTESPEVQHLLTQLLEFGVSIRDWRIVSGLPVPPPQNDPSNPDILLPEDGVLNS